MNRWALTMLLLVLSDSFAEAHWQQQTIKSQGGFRGLCVANSAVAWVSGTNGTYARTIDAGKTWSVGTVPDAEKLDFRDVEVSEKARPTC